MTTTTEALSFIESTSTRHAKAQIEATQDFFVAYVTNSRVNMQAARRDLERVATDTLAFGEIVGASTVLRDVAKVLRDEKLFRASAIEENHVARFADAPTQSIIPRVTFDEAVQDIVDRTPRTIRRAAQRTAANISEIYGNGRAVAFARSAEASVTKRAQAFIAEALAEGIPEGEAGRRLALEVNQIRKRSRKWSESYGRMVFRTNANTGVTAGRFRQAQDPDVRAATPAFRFDSVGDSDTRDNHDAADGIILSVTSVEWRFLAPPLGFNCRCQVALVSRFVLEAMGRIKGGQVVDDRVPFNARPDPGFRARGRPDLALKQLVR